MTRTWKNVGETRSVWMVFCKLSRQSFFSSRVSPFSPDDRYFHKMSKPAYTCSEQHLRTQCIRGNVSVVALCAQFFRRDNLSVAALCRLQSATSDWPHFCSVFAGPASWSAGTFQYLVHYIVGGFLFRHPLYNFRVSFVCWPYGHYGIFGDIRREFFLCHIIMWVFFPSKVCHLKKVNFVCCPLVNHHVVLRLVRSGIRIRLFS